MKRDRRRRGADVAAVGGGSSRRAERVASEIQRVVSQVLVRDIGDARASAANVTRVKVTPDLRHARVYFALLSTGDENPAETAAALTRAAPYLRKRIAQDLELRFTPDLAFFFDEGLAGARRIDLLLRRLHEEPGD